MSAADDIYDAAIKDLAARARNMGRIEDADCSHDADNFLCGDRVTVEVALKGDAVENIVSKTGQSQDEARKALSSFSPQGRLMSPEEIAACVGYLVSDAAAGITGQAMAVDGGETA